MVAEQVSAASYALEDAGFFHLFEGAGERPLRTVPCGDFILLRGEQLFPLGIAFPHPVNRHSPVEAVVPYHDSRRVFRSHPIPPYAASIIAK
jgi:hypothetical protein